MAKILRVEELPEDAKVFLKKDMFGYRIVNPIKDENGKIIWINLLVGGWRNLVTLIIILLFMWWLITYTNSYIDKYRDYCEPISKDPVKFCQNIGYYDAMNYSKGFNQVSFNFTFEEVRT